MLGLPKRNSTLNYLLALALGMFATGCTSYKANIMFKIPEGYALAQAVQQAEGNYIIATNDLLELSVYSSDGERIIDPDFKLIETLPSTSNTTLRPIPKYLVDVNGRVKFPMIGEVSLSGLTLRQAEAVLQQAYAQFYSRPFVTLTNLSKRVVVLGAPGGRVIPLAHDNIELVEVLALAEGIDNNARANNIRVIRGDRVFLVDFSTINGFKQGNMVMEPGDIIYIEPIRRPAAEGARDLLPVVSLFTSMATLLVVILSL